MRHKLRQTEPSSWTKWSLLAAGFLSALPLGFAQEDEEDEIFELSPFTVDGSQDEGYRATQTLAGGRLATNLKDIGTSVEVLTKEFLEDVGANDVEEFLQYTTGGEVGGSQGNIEGASTGGSQDAASSAGTRAEPHTNTRLRGIGRPDYVRNYYKTNIPMDSYNTSRVDINRGANSFLFGLGQPAGLINSSYVQAEMRDHGKLEFQVGSGGDTPSFRTSVDFNRVLIEDRLAVRFATVHDRKKYRQNPSFRDSDRQYFAIKFKPTDSTTLRGHIESGEIFGNAPDTLLPTHAFDTFIDRRLPIDFWQNRIRYGDPEGPSQDVWDSLPPEEQATIYPINDGGSQLLSTGRMWGWSMVYDGANGSEPSYAMRAQMNNALIGGDNDFWTAEGGSGSPQMLFWRNKRNGEATNGAGPSQGFTSLDGFDFSKQNFGGDSDYYSHDFSTFNLTLEQLFFDGQVGFEIGYDHEGKDDDAVSNFNRGAEEFMIDINKTIPLPYVDANGNPLRDGDGNVIAQVQENPNFGRPVYITAPTRRIVNDEKETLRATAFVKYDFTEKHSDSPLKWLGKHTFNFLTDKFTETRRFASMRQQAYSDDFNIAWMTHHQDADQPSANYRQLHKMVYMGPAVQTYLSDPFNPNTPLNLNDIIIQPPTANLLDPNPMLPITYWNLGPDAEGSNWTHHINPDPVNNHIPNGNHDLINEPDTYVGDRSEYWSSGSIYGDWSLSTSNSIRKTIVTSQAVNLQSMFLNNHLVTNLGYREDVVENWLESRAPELHDLALEGLVSESYLGDRSYTVDPEFFYPETGQYTEIDKGPTGEGSFGYGGVLHLPKDFLVFEMPRDTSISFHYNYSKNFVPDASRNTFVPGQDWFYGPLSSPIGEGEDIGFTVDLNSKLIARVNWYETSVQNATASGLGNVSNALVSWAHRTRAWAQQDLNDWDPDGNRIIDVDKNGNPHSRRNQDWWDLNRLDTVIEATEWSVTDGWEAARVEGGYLTYNPNGSVKRNQWLPGLQDTESRTSKGLEVNLTYNPTRQWRIAMNVAKINSVSSDVGPMTTTILDNFFESYNQIKEFHLWNAADTRAHTRPFKNWFQNHINRYWIAKLQEGSATAETREWSGSVVTNYRFTDGRFKGFSMGGAVRYRGEGAIGYPLMDYAVTEDVTLSVPDVSSPYMSQVNWNVDMNFGYRTKVFQDKVDWDLRLHLKNLNNLSSDGLTTFRVNYDGTAANVRWDPPFDVRLTSSFKF